LVEQKEVGAITREHANLNDVPTEIRMVSDVGNVLHGQESHLFAITKTIGDLHNGTGEEIQVDPRHPDEYMNPQFEIDVLVDNVGDKAGNKYVPGQKAWVRFQLGKQPLGWQWYRKLQQLLQT